MTAERAVIRSQLLQNMHNRVSISIITVGEDKS